LDHPVYSPDLAPCDFWLLQKLKIALKGREFYEISNIQRQVLKELKTIPNDQFQESFEQQKHRLTECIDAQVTVAASVQVIKDNFYVVILGIKLSQWYMSFINNNYMFRSSSTTETYRC
jgi:hypothetical protein